MSYCVFYAGRKAIYLEVNVLSKKEAKLKLKNIANSFCQKDEIAVGEIYNKTNLIKYKLSNNSKKINIEEL